MTALDPTYDKIAKKIVAIFSDGRLTYDDWHFIGLYAVTNGREDWLLNRIDHFAAAVLEYRQQIEFGRKNVYEQDTLF